MQRWQCLIYILSKLNLIKNVNETVVFSLENFFLLRVSPLLHINKKCASNFRLESTIENKQLIKHKHCYNESLYDGLDFILILLIFRHSSLLC